MITGLLSLILSPQLISYKTYLGQFELEEYSTKKSLFAYVRKNPPLHIRLQTQEIENKEARFDVLAAIKNSSQRPSDFDSLPKTLPNHITLGFETLYSKNRSWKEDIVYAFGNHCYVNVKVSGLFVETDNRREIKEKEPIPQNTEEIATNLATLFFAEQEALRFQTNELRQKGNNFHTLTGPDGAIYYSLATYANSVHATFTLDPSTGAGTINSTPPLTFNLGSRNYKMGTEQRAAEHIVVLKSGEAYIPAEMIGR